MSNTKSFAELWDEALKAVGLRLRPSDGLVAVVERFGNALVAQTRAELVPEVDHTLRVDQLWDECGAKGTIYSDAPDEWLERFAQAVLHRHMELRPVLDLTELFNTQYRLQERLGWPNGHGEAGLKENLLHAMIEAVEALRETNYKPHSKNRRVVDQQALATELTDILQFWANAAIAMGLMPEALTAALRAKWQVNYQRADEQVGHDFACPACRSEGFAPSNGGRTCHFCDGTYAGQGPSNQAHRPVQLVDVPQPRKHPALAAPYGQPPDPDQSDIYAQVATAVGTTCENNLPAPSDNTPAPGVNTPAPSDNTPVLSDNLPSTDNNLPDLDLRDVRAHR